MARSNEDKKPSRTAGRATRSAPSGGGKSQITTKELKPPPGDGVGGGQGKQERSSKYMREKEKAEQNAEALQTRRMITLFVA